MGFIPHGLAGPFLFACHLCFLGRRCLRESRLLVVWMDTVIIKKLNTNAVDAN